MKLRNSYKGEFAAAVAVVYVFLLLWLVLRTSVLRTSSRALEQDAVIVL